MHLCTACPAVLSAGIPISLSIVYMEVAARLGLKMAGVNLPAHFMIRPQVRPVLACCQKHSSSSSSSSKRQPACTLHEMATGAACLQPSKQQQQQQQQRRWRRQRWRWRQALVWLYRSACTFCKFSDSFAPACAVPLRVMSTQRRCAHAGRSWRGICCAD
jgi:hypothetical protein